MTSAAILDIVLRADTSSATTALRRYQGQLGKVDKTVTTSTRTTSRLGDATKTTGSRLASAARYAAGAAAAYLSISQAKAAVETTQQLAGASATLTRNLGLTTKQASRWASVARTRDVDTKTLNASFTTLASNLADVRNGVDDAIDPFKALGITQKDLQKDGNNFNKTLFTISDALDEAKGGAERQAAAADLLGRGYQNLVPIMGQGSDALREQLKLGDQYGATMGKKAVKAQTDLTAKLRESERAWQGLQVSFTTMITPAISDANDVFQQLARIMASDKLTNAEKFEKVGNIIGKWADKALDVFIKVLPQFVERAAEAAPKIAKALAEGIMNAPIWGVLLLGGWLLKGAALAALGAAAGRKIAGGIGVGMSAGLKSLAMVGGPAAFASVIINEFEKMSKPVQAVKDFGNAIEKTFMESLGVSRHAAQGIIEQGNRLGKSFDQLRAGFNQTRKSISNDIENLSNTWGQNLSEIRQRTQENMQRIRETMGANSKAGRQAISDNFFAAVQAIKNSMKSGEISAEKGAKAIHNVLVKQLKSYGIRDVEGFLNRQEQASQAHEGGGASGLQKGGLVPGQGAGDKVPLHVAGQLAAMVEPGEYVSVANRKATNALMRANKAVPRFRQGGEATGMSAMVAAANAYEAKGYPYVWGGGHGDVAWPDTEPVDCSGAVSAVLHAAGLLDAPMVSGALASWGKAGSGPLTVYANSGHTFMSLDGKFFGTSSSNPGGGAGWMGDPGASYISGFAKRTTDVAGGSAIAEAAGNVKLPRYSSDFGLGLMVAQGLNNMAAGTEKTMNQRLAARVPSGSFGGGQPLRDIEGARFESTSYGPPWGGIQGTGITATGVNLMDSPQIYGVAVDPDVIALGSKLRIAPNPFDYGGIFKAFDTGGAIQGNRIDFYDWRGRDEQLGWGTRSVEVERAMRGGILRLVEGGTIPELFPQLGSRDQDTRKEAQARILEKIGRFGMHPDTLTRLFQGTNALAEHQEYATLAAAGDITDANDNLIPGLFRAGTEHSWLLKAREEAWTLRENLINADTAMRPQIAAFESKDGLIKKAEKRLEQVRDALHDAQDKLRDLLEEIERQRKIIEDAREKLALTGNKELSESQKRHQRQRIDVAQGIIENISGQRVPAVEDAIDRATRERDALVEPVIPALAAKFEELRAIKDGIRGDSYSDELTGMGFDGLKTIQGMGSSMDLMPMPDDLHQHFGGTLNDIQQRLLAMIPEAKPGDSEIDQLEAALALAGLTADLSDDIASQAEIVSYWERELARLQESGSPASEIGSAANSLQSARDALASLQETSAPEGTGAETDALKLEALMAENARLRMSAQQAGTFAGFFRQFSAMPQFATGGVMDRTGPALVHGREGIFTPEQMKAMGGRGDVIVNVNLDGMDVVVETFIGGVLAKETRKALGRGPTAGRKTAGRRS